MVKIKKVKYTGVLAKPIVWQETHMSGGILGGLLKDNPRGNKTNIAQIEERLLVDGI